MTVRIQLSMDATKRSALQGEYVPRAAASPRHGRAWRVPLALTLALALACPRFGAMSITVVPESVPPPIDVYILPNAQWLGNECLLGTRASKCTILRKALHRRVRSSWSARVTTEQLRLIQVCNDSIARADLVTPTKDGEQFEVGCT